MATDYYQLRVKGLHTGQYNECVMYFRGTNLTAADYMQNADDLVDTWNDGWRDMWLELFPTTYQLLRVEAKKASSGGGGMSAGQYDFDAYPGTVAGSAASQQLCPAISLIPGMGVKSAGKIFLPCIAESQIQANVPNSTWLTNVDTLLVSLIAGITFASITWDLVIYSRTTSSFNAVADYSTSPIIGFQRRRQRLTL